MERILAGLTIGLLMFGGLAQATENCATVDASLNVNIPCVSVGGQVYQVVLNNYRNQTDPSGLYWQLGTVALTTDNGSCASFDNSTMTVNLPCLEANGSRYTLTLNRYVNQADSPRLYWSLGTYQPLTDTPPSISATCPLNDTGMAWYGSNTANFLAAAPTGFEGQDASYGRDALAFSGQLSKIGGGNGGFDFSKLDSNGNVLPSSADSWSCVRDNHTGFVWEEKTNDGGLRDKDWGYTWYNSSTLSNGGFAGTAGSATDTTSCGGTLATGCDTEKFSAAVNSSGLCGFNDWRLPNRRELFSLVDLSGVRPANAVVGLGTNVLARIDTNYFQNLSTGTSYWTSSPCQSISSYAVVNVVDFSSGLGRDESSSYSWPVRLVRGGQ